MRFALQAEVRHGRLVDLDEAERERLHAALRRSAEQFARGEGRAAEDALRRLRQP